MADEPIKGKSIIEQEIARMVREAGGDEALAKQLQFPSLEGERAANLVFDTSKVEALAAKVVTASSTPAALIEAQAELYAHVVQVIPELAAEEGANMSKLLQEQVHLYAMKLAKDGKSTGQIKSAVSSLADRFKSSFGSVIAKKSVFLKELATFMESELEVKAARYYEGIHTIASDIVPSYVELNRAVPEARILPPQFFASSNIAAEIAHVEALVVPAEATAAHAEYLAALKKLDAHKTDFNELVEQLDKATEGRVKTDKFNAIFKEAGDVAEAKGATIVKSISALEKAANDGLKVEGFEKIKGALQSRLPEDKAGFINRVETMLGEHGKDITLTNKEIEDLLAKMKTARELGTKTFGAAAHPQEAIAFYEAILGKVTNPDIKANLVNEIHTDLVRNYTKLLALEPKIADVAQLEAHLAEELTHIKTFLGTHGVAPAQIFTSLEKAGLNTLQFGLLDMRTARDIHLEGIEAAYTTASTKLSHSLGDLAKLEFHDGSALTTLKAEVARLEALAAETSKNKLNAADKKAVEAISDLVTKIEKSVADEASLKGRLNHLTAAPLAAEVTKLETGLKTISDKLLKLDTDHDLASAKLSKTIGPKAATSLIGKIERGTLDVAGIDALEHNDIAKRLLKELHATHGERVNVRAELHQAVGAGGALGGEAKRLVDLGAQTDVVETIATKSRSAAVTARDAFATEHGLEALIKEGVTLEAQAERVPAVGKLVTARHKLHVVQAEFDTAYGKLPKDIKARVDKVLASGGSWDDAKKVTDGTFLTKTDRVNAFRTALDNRVTAMGALEEARTAVNTLITDGHLTATEFKMDDVERLAQRAAKLKDAKLTAFHDGIGNATDVKGLFTHLEDITKAATETVKDVAKDTGGGKKWIIGGAIAAVGAGVALLAFGDKPRQSHADRIRQQQQGLVDMTGPAA